MSARDLAARGHPAVWAASMIVSFAAIALLRITDAIGPTTGFLLMVVAMVQLIPLTHVGLARQKAAGHLSPAAIRYTRRFLIASFAYMLGLGLAVTIRDRVDVAQGGAFLLALLPVVPIMGMIWTMARYVREEDDEYLRHRAIMAALLGLGLVLALGTFWGFLETFGVVPHVPAWACFPVWAIGMGAAQCWLARRDRTGADE